jgi:hypothetical protein
VVWHNEGMDVANAVVSVLEQAERGAVQGRRALDRVQLRLHSWRLALDPQTRVWVDETRQALADGTLQHQAFDRQELLRMSKAVRSEAT